MSRRISLAAWNNALWCDAVCRSHGLRGTLDSAAWSSPARTPPFYPDAVTLTESVLEVDLLDRIDASVGASVKDCWALLDLTAAGFARIIEGRWLWLGRDRATTAAPGDGRVWHSVESAAQMERWSRTWASDPEDAAVLGPALLRERGVHVLGARDVGDHLVAGCIVNLTGEVAGITNVFASDGDHERAWRGAVAAAVRAAPGQALVGWESDDGVAAARSSGFSTLGPLWVWSH